jgi:hypothetical protein
MQHRHSNLADELALHLLHHLLQRHSLRQLHCERGKGRFRPKDLFDLYVLARHAPLNPTLIPRALRLAFDSRGDSLDLTSRLHSGAFGKSPWSLEKWARFRNSLPEGRPEQLATRPPQS